MAPKKKKTQLKPVARGFATTSVPKKVVEVPKEPEPVPTNDAPDASKDHASDPDAPGQTPKGGDAPALSEEDQVLQTFIEKFQDKVEKEIVRTVKAIEQDRRFSDTLLRLDLDPTFVERILALALEYEGTESSKSIDEPEDKALVRLAITYGSLRRLGFSEIRVDQCLRSIPGVELDEAVEWLHLHCEEEELGARHESAEPPRTPMTPKTPRTARSSHLRAESSTASSAPPSPSVTSSLDASAPAFVPGKLALDTSIPSVSSRAEVTDGGSTPSTTADPASSVRWSPVEDPNDEFVRLKLRIMDLTTYRRADEKADASFLQELQRRLTEVQQDYLFDQREAEAMFVTERSKVEATALQDKLRGAATATPPKKPQPVRRKVKEPPSRAESVASASTTDVFEDDEAAGGMFELLEQMPETTTENGVTVQVRDMGLPKHWSGRTPKVLLTENVRKTDRYAVITFTNISGHSRVKRSSVDVRWDGGKTQSWSMDDVACHDLTQAEHYIATVALHALTFPTSEGFAPGGTASGSQTSFRLLPPVFRDLWDELEQKRRVDDDVFNRAVWGRLRDILSPKLSRSEKTNGRPSRQPTEAKDNTSNRYVDHSNDIPPEQLIAEFEARQASPAYQDMLQQRNQLPMAQYRQDLLSLLEMSQILVLSGETGCGKSTQVPAFILEDQLLKGRHCKIYCTEPRRISAISLAQRVSRELGEPAGAVGTGSSLVGYAIRLENNISRRTRLAYVTNGIALRMLEGGSGQGGQGTAFDEITHIIIDEVHERTIESDFLLIVLKSLLVQRPDLKIILMSATLEADKISHYFGGCPVLSVPGRTFPVDVRFLEDAVELTKWKVAEGSPYARRGAGKDKFYRNKARLEWTEDTAAGDDDDDDAGPQENVTLEKRYSSETISTVNLLDERLIAYDLIVRLLEKICFEDPSYESYSSAILVFMPGMGEIRRLNDILTEHRSFGREDQFRIYPLHSTISSEQQGAVFDIPPLGVRKIVIATNIAETGITIPDITCVIDTGKHREMRFDEKRQISRLIETYIARSNAAQRRGRAGRVQSGLCFHLFTKARHDTKLAAHPDPEIMRLSLSDLALRIKIMKVNLGTSIEDVLSRALDPPLAINVQRAVSALVEVRALTQSEEITPMGRLLSQLPTDVHLGKFLLVATLFRCLDPALTIAATLNSKSPFLTPLGLEHEAERAKLSFRVENSDFLSIHNAFASWRRASGNGIARKFCKSNYLSHQNLQQIEELRQQFLGYLVDSSFIHVDRGFVRDLSRARYSRNKTRFVMVPSDLDVNSGNAAMVNAALAAGLYPKILTVDPLKREMRTIGNNQPASFHPSSFNFKKRLTDFGVNHLCYFTLMHSKKLYAWETGPVEDMALLLLCGDAEFKLMADTAFIDRKVRFRIEPKASIALKLLRNNLGSILATQFKTRPLTECQLRWDEIAMMILGKVKPEGPPQMPDAVTLVINNRH